MTTEAPRTLPRRKLLMDIARVTLGATALGLLTTVPSDVERDTTPVNPKKVETFVNKFGQKVIDKVNKMPELKPKLNTDGSQQFSLFASFVSKDNKAIENEVEVTVGQNGISGMTFIKNEDGIDYLFYLQRNPDGKNWHFSLEKKSDDVPALYLTTQVDDPQLKNPDYKVYPLGYRSLGQIEEQFGSFVDEIIDHL